MGVGHQISYLRDNIESFCRSEQYFLILFAHQSRCETAYSIEAETAVSCLSSLLRRYNISNLSINGKITRIGMGDQIGYDSQIFEFFMAF